MTILSPLARPSPLSRLGALRTPALILGGSLLMAVCARTQIPFWPVPMTMQVFGVFLLAALAGGRQASAMIVLYLAEGALGLPVFANATGPAALLGPTGGYLIGFAVAALLAGEWMTRAGWRGTMASGFPMLAGLLVIYLCGAAWLARFVGWPNVLATGVLPFVIGDLLKITLAATVATALLRPFAKVQ